MQMVVDGSSQQEQLAAYVRQLSNCQDGRGGVWLEHSYARGGGGGGVRVLCGRSPAARPYRIDVTTVAEPPVLPIGGTGLAVPDETGSEEEGWEERLWAAAPAAAHRDLAAASLQILYDLRLQLLAQRDISGSEWLQEHSIRTAGRKLRLAAVGCCGGTVAGGNTWVKNALTACLPPYLLHLYRTATAAASVPPPVDSVVPVASESSAVTAVWIGGYGAPWEGAISRVLPVKVVPAPSAEPHAPPDQYTATCASQALPGFLDLLTGPTVVCGYGAGAALACALSSAVSSEHIKGLVLLAPPLHTADNSYHSITQLSRGIPSLVVLGGTVAGVTGARRIICVAPADERLKLSPDVARRLCLPPAAIRAAVAEEIARWSNELMQDNDEPRSDGDNYSPGGERLQEELEYAHLPALAPTNNHRPKRSIEIVEGRVVSRVAGGTPLPLAPPRRAPSPPAPAPPAPPAPAPPSLAAADIMKMPIVFADDDVTDNDVSPPKVPAKVQVAKVQVAKISSGTKLQGVTKIAKIQELRVRSPAPPPAAGPQPELLTVTSGNPREAGGQVSGALCVRRVVVGRRAAAPLLLRRTQPARPAHPARPAARLHRKHT